MHSGSIDMVDMVATKRAVSEKILLLVRLTGFEPAAFRVGAERSIQLSYNRTPILITQGESVITIIADSCGKCK